jgi:hypothetical protein
MGVKDIRHIYVEISHNGSCRLNNESMHFVVDLEPGQPFAMCIAQGDAQAREFRIPAATGERSAAVRRRCFSTRCSELSRRG